MTAKISSPYVLLVEGKDELNVFSKIQSVAGFGALQIIDVGGQDRFRPTVEALANQGAFADVRLLGVVRDCEENGEAVFQSVLGAFEKIGAPRPERRGETAGEKLRVLVELLPPDRNTGCLETLFVEAAEAIEAGRCHQILADCVRNLPIGKDFTKARFDKIAALAILSSFRGKYYTRVGEALQSDEFRSFLDAAPMRPLWTIVEKMQRLSKEVE